MSELLTVKGLETQFKTRYGTVHAVNGVSFSLDQGETLGVVGESGCGKSVSMMSLLRLIPSPPGKVTAGEALFHGKDLLRMSDEEIRGIRGKKISVVFQNPMTSFNPVHTIGDQVAEPWRIHTGADRKEAYERAVRYLELVGIPNPEDHMKRYPHEFSGGMRQRVMIAMSLICEPEILIADEPTTALDVTIQAQIVELVKGRDYTAEYTSNVSAGKALVTVKGIGNFKGTLKKAFTILPAEILKASVTGNLTYTGQPLEPKVTVRAKLLKKTVVLQPGRDYTVTCSGNVDAGTARVTVTGTGDYTGTLQKSFTIAPAKILRVILSADRMAYTGEPIRPEVTVRTKLGGVLTVLEEGKDYTLTFTDDIGPGTASVTVTGIGNFTGVFVREFTIE